MASMHDLPGVKVEFNVRIPSLGKSHRKREIDVLLSSSLAGYSVQIAIECKNEKNVIGAPKIDAFVGKLLDIGIPPQHGIYVSASGYTSGAIERAKEGRIKPLVLTGLTKERLTASVAEAFQSIVYLLLDVVNINVKNKVASTPNYQKMLVFYDDHEKLCGSIPDIIWQKWLAGEPASAIGEYEIQLAIPPNWYQIVDDKIEPIISASARIRIIGLVITISGQAKKHFLINANDNKVEKFQLDVSFDTGQGTYSVLTMLTESQLTEFVKRPEAVKVNIGRIRLPRIRVGPMYWPPSERTARIVINLMRAFEAGKIPDPRPIDIAELEGNDLQTIWEPIWSEHQQLINKQGEAANHASRRTAAPPLTNDAFCQKCVIIEKESRRSRRCH